MARARKIAFVHRNPTHIQAAIQEVVNSNSTSKRLRQRVAPLLNSQELLRNVQGLTPEDQIKFMEKVDQVRRSSVPLLRPSPHRFYKVYPIIDTQNAEFVTTLGGVCSAIGRLPTSAVIPVGLEKRGSIAVASGGSTDIWRGKWGDKQVAIKAFRIHPAENLKEAKDVRVQSASLGVHLLNEICRSYGNVCLRGENYPTKMYYHSSA